MNRYARPKNFGHPIRNPLLREHFVYRAYNAADELLYVGCTKTLEARLSAHRSQSHWVPDAVRLRVCGPYNYEVARQIEHDAIESERALFNHSSERRWLARLHSQLVNLYYEDLVRRQGARIGTWGDSLHAACDLANEALPYDNLGPIRFTDLTIPNARRVVAEVTESLGAVA